VHLDILIFSSHLYSQNGFIWSKPFKPGNILWIKLCFYKFSLVFQENWFESKARKNFTNKNFLKTEFFSKIQFPKLSAT
jgi:hypothetical protein